MYKYLLIPIISLIFFMEVNAQTTYSSLEFIDDQPTGNAIDITIYNLGNGDVEYDISLRTATSSDKSSTFILTGAQITEINNSVEFSASSDTYFIPFDMLMTAYNTGGGTMTINCKCNGRVTHDHCSTNSNQSGGEVTVECVENGCIFLCSTTTYSSNNFNSTSSGIFIDATNVSQR